MDLTTLDTNITPREYSLHLCTGDLCQYLGSEMLEESHIWGLRITAYEKFDIWSLGSETKLQKKTKFYSCNRMNTHL